MREFYDYTRFTITSNVYSFNTNGAIPVVPTPGAGGSGSGTSASKYLKLNADKVAFDEDAGMIYLAFDSSHDAEIEMLQLDTAGSTINLDTTSFALTDRQINVKPTFGFWVKTSSNINQVWSGKISYKYRIKGMVTKTDSVTLSPENPELTLTMKEAVALGMHDAILDARFNAIKGENQEIDFKDVTVYDSSNQVIQVMDASSVSWSDSSGHASGRSVRIAGHSGTWGRAKKMTYKYRFAGKPWSAVKEVKDFKPQNND